jgi:aspartate 1-decarboxylase
MSFGLYTMEEARIHQPQIIVVNERNEVLRQP